MNINRHNYEEFFILYLDNELDAAGRKAVETFAAEHPDLKEELELLQQYRLEPDASIVYPGKEELLKGEQGGAITLQNYEEFLLLYTDHELNDQDRQAVEKFAGENAAVKKELELLLQTRLEPEQISFPDKNSLYKSEEKVRVLPVRWWRAAAAVLLLGAGITAVLLNKKESPVPDDAVAVQPAGQLPSDTIRAQKNPAAAEDPVTRYENAFALNDNEPVQPAVRSPRKDNSVQTAGKVTADPQPELAQNENPKTNNLSVPVSNPNIKEEKQESALARLELSPEKTKQPDKNSLTNPVVTNPDPSPSDIMTASFKEDNGQKKNKLRGFFRKVTRTFEKRTNIDPTDEDNRLLVGGLAIKLN